MTETEKRVAVALFPTVDYPSDFMVAMARRAIKAYLCPPEPNPADKCLSLLQKFGH